MNSGAILLLLLYCYMFLNVMVPTFTFILAPAIHLSSLIPWSLQFITDTPVKIILRVTLK